MKVMLSIKPEYAKRIFSGEKRYEYRRILFKNPAVRKVVVYESAPTSKVVGEFEVSEIISASPTQLWKSTHHHSGVDEAFFFSYFAERSVAYAIKVKNPVRYPKALDLKQKFALSMPPQSFAYLY
mgnify:CR=1 FL=1